jgi:formamidopyrimidine-DNA glycosylase
VPELVEVERYRTLADRALGRVIGAVESPDPWFLKGGLSPDGIRAVLVGRRFLAARRIGKLLLLDVTVTDADADTDTDTDADADADADAEAEAEADDGVDIDPADPGFRTDPGSDGHDVDRHGSDGPVVGVRFGMTGSLLVDGTDPVGRLLYSSTRNDPKWDRWTVTFVDGGRLVVHDPRRLGGVTLDPDVSHLGADAATIGVAGLGRALAGSSAPLKARLLDQARVAGVGNLIADEVLWRAGLSPLRPVSSLRPAEIRRLQRHLGRTIADLSARGGSHLGDLMDERHPGGICPKDGTALVRSTVGGRTTWWCPAHQVG